MGSVSGADPSMELVAVPLSPRLGAEAAVPSGAGARLAPRAPTESRCASPPASPAIFTPEQAARMSGEPALPPPDLGQAPPAPRGAMLSRASPCLKAQQVPAWLPLSPFPRPKWDRSPGATSSITPAVPDPAPVRSQGHTTARHRWLPPASRTRSKTPSSCRGCVPGPPSRPPKREQAGECVLPPRDPHREHRVHGGSRLLVIAAGRERGTEPGKQEVAGHQTHAGPRGAALPPGTGASDNQTQVLKKKKKI